MGPLVHVDDLAGFPGAPFSLDVVTAAGDAVRRACGWHIAPKVTETVVVDGHGGPTLVLPSLYVTDVVEVRDTAGTVLTGWRRVRNFLVRHRGGWPVGLGAVEVDMVHGYESCPSELFPVVARGAQRRVAQESLGSRSVSYEKDVAAPDVVAAFKLPARP